MPGKGYKNISIPSNLVKKVDEFLENHPEYNSRADFLKECIRNKLKQEKALITEEKLDEEIEEQIEKFLENH